MRNIEEKKTRRSVQPEEKRFQKTKPFKYVGPLPLQLMMGIAAVAVAVAVLSKIYSRTPKVLRMVLGRW